MDNENKLPLSKVLENIITSFFNIIGDIGSLAITEARLAKQSAMKILFLSLVSLLFIIATWISLQALIVTFLISINISLLLSLVVVTSLNFLSIGIIFLYIKRLKQNLYFKATRRQISQTADLLKDPQ